MKPLSRTRILISLIPILVLIVLLALDVSIFGSDSILGASQVALLTAAGVCIWLSMWLFKTPWKDFEKAISSNIGNVTTAIVILLLIGAISGTWTMSGVIPTLIYYGVQIISPKVFLATACIICAVVSVMIGSSWTTIATIAQPHIITEIGEKITSGNPSKVLFAGIVETIYNSVSISTGHPEVDSLVASRGMTGMLNTIYLIICALCFGGCMNASGMLRHLASLLIPLSRRRTSLVAGTVATGTVLNGIVSDQYLSIILTGNLYQGLYNKKGYAPELLSRSIEDSATVTSPLFPWSSCGMTQATILGVATLVYAPFCFFNWISPLMSIFIAATGYKINKPNV